MAGDKVKSSDKKSRSLDKLDKKLNLFWRIKEVITDWHKTVLDVLNYKPDSEWIVQLICKTDGERNEILKTEKFLTGEKFRLQIWKTKEGWWTIYSDLMLWIWIEYMINHTKWMRKINYTNIFRSLRLIATKKRKMSTYTRRRKRTNRKNDKWKVLREMKMYWGNNMI